jgi:hypothetical protein
MKKSALFLLGTLITGMAFSLVLAGCATTGGTEDPTAAEQLSADINKISARRRIQMAVKLSPPARAVSSLVWTAKTAVRPAS